MYLSRAGFTLVELLASIALLAVIATFTVVGFRNYARFQEYQQAVATVKATLHDAKVKARSSEGGVARGVQVATGSLTVFPGTVFASANSQNQVITFGNVRLIPSLSGGGSAVVFSNLTGLPSATGTVQVVGLIHSATTTITITGTGGIE